jgi:Rrf2 family transcriptional regulator, iron-sulfur cluster assembly transcription factor
MTMRLEITRRADLATRALVALADDGHRMKAARLAEVLGTTAGFVPQILHPLVARGWVASEPGPTGGYTRVAPLESISVLEVIEAVDGPTVTGRCVLEDRPCTEIGPCALHHPWSRARAHLLDELGATRLSDLDVAVTPHAEGKAP